jgi:hypothetical protein
MRENAREKRVLTAAARRFGMKPEPCQFNMLALYACIAYN